MSKKMIFVLNAAERTVSTAESAETAEDLAARQPTLAELINKKYKEICDAQCAAVNSLFAAYTTEQKETFWVQVAEAESWTADNQHPTPFIDGRVAAEGSAKADVVADILAVAEAAKPASGQIFGRKRLLENQLAAVDHTGDYQTELAKLDAIAWS
jgi:hypothetical protein